MTVIHVDELLDNHVCNNCVDEAFLAGLVREAGRQGRCSYCQNPAVGVSLAVLAGHIERAFKEHFRRSATESDGLMPISDWEREGEPVVYAITDAAEVSEELAANLQKILADCHADKGAARLGEETEFDDESHYVQIFPSSREWREHWYEFEHTLKERSRFFSHGCYSQLEAIFSGIDTMQTREGKPVIQELAPESSDALFYRARVFFDDAKVEQALKRPDLELAPPPSEFASAGRMNAKGISVFYGANTVAGALAEIRPPVGSKVVVGEFRPLRTVRLLNLPALESVHIDGSIFDPNYAETLSRMGFVRTLSERMSRPIMPKDVDFDYLPTQAVADFLANHSTYNLDGIRFSSIQTGEASDNIVLFHRASRVRLLDIPKGTEVSAQSAWSVEDGPKQDYRVTERVLAPDEDVGILKPPRSILRFRSLDIDEPDHDHRENTLAVDVNTLSVHWIGAIDVTAKSYDVSRDRFERPQSGCQFGLDF